MTPDILSGSGKPMRVFVSVSDDFEIVDGERYYWTTFYCPDKRAAKHDHAILGSMWEAPNDLIVAYAGGPAVRDGDITELLADLRSRGYDAVEDEP